MALQGACLHGSVNAERSWSACGEVVKNVPTLRAPFVNLTAQVLVQEVMNKLLQWQPEEDLDCKSIKGRPAMALDAPLTSFGLAKRVKHAETYFVWTKTMRS